MSATPNDRTPQERIDELVVAGDALAAALQRLMQDPTVGRAEAIAAHLDAMRKCARVLAVALGEVVAGEVA